MYATDSKSIRIVIAGIFSLGMLQIAHALGLGPITVNSHIGEPLQATINVSGLDAAQAAGTTVGIADQRAYQSRGITKLPTHDQLRLSLQPAANGYYINVASQGQIREPFLNFVISVKQNGKETLREYAVFLDPATGAAINTPALVPEPVAVPTTKLLVNQPASTQSSGWKGKPVPVKAAPTVAAKTASWQGGSTYGPVQNGETLYSIATAVRPSADYSIQTVMRQIFQANRHAFSGNRLDSLMAGYTLTIPAFEKKLVSMPTAPKPKTSQQRTQPQQIAAPAETTDSIEEVEEPVIDMVDNTPNEGVGITESDSMVLLNPEENILVEETPQEDSNILFVDEPQDTDTTTFSVEEPSSTDNTNDISVFEPEPSVGNNITVVEIDEQPQATAPVVNTTPVTPPAIENNRTTTPAVIDKPTPAPVVQEETSFLNTTYAILPMWQWLIIAAAILLALILVLLKLRKKEAIGEEPDALDQAEMDAVLAKIHALEENGQQKADTFHNEPTDADDYDGLLTDLDEQEDHEPFDPMIENEQMIFEEHEHSLAQGHDDAVSEETEFDDFDLNEFEESSTVHLDKETAEPAPESATAMSFEDDDFDFFVEEDDDDAAHMATETMTIIPSQPEHDEPVTHDVTLTEHDADDFDLDELFMDEEDTSDYQSSPVESKQPNQPAVAQTDSLDDDFNFDDSLQTQAASEEDSSSSVNTEEMEINLDLASSFIATGHGEKSISWLEEVVELGTDEQKARARELLRKARGG